MLNGHYSILLIGLVILLMGLINFYLVYLLKKALRIEDIQRAHDSVAQAIEELTGLTRSGRPSWATQGSGQTTSGSRADPGNSGSTSPETTQKIEQLERNLKTAMTNNASLRKEKVRLIEEAATFRTRLERQEAQLRAFQQDHLLERQKMLEERQSLEQKIQEQQAAMDQKLSLIQDPALQESLEKISKERDRLELERRKIEQKLNDLQDNYDRMVTEKRFIESVFLSERENEEALKEIARMDEL